MDTVDIAEFKRNVPAFVNRAASGLERILLTSRGVPKAALVSVEDLHKLEVLDRTSSPPSSQTQRKAALAIAQAVREMTLARRGGVPFSDVDEDLRRLREGRDLHR